MGRGEHHDVAQEELRPLPVRRRAAPGEERQGDLEAVAVALGVAFRHDEAERKAGQHRGGPVAGGKQRAQHRATPSHGWRTMP
jgi:hypothetical protein